MSTFFIDLAVGVVIFILGISLTVKRFGTQNRIALTVVAILSPLVAVYALLRVIFQIFTGNRSIGRCPAGLEEAERVVEQQRQHMFGGPLREPSFAKSWQLAYERELQRDTERVREVAERYLVIA